MTGLLPAVLARLLEDGTVGKALDVDRLPFQPGVPVPRFFFDTDDEGQELEGLEAAKVVAQEELPHMARDELPDGDQRTFIVSVRDETGQVVLRASLSLIVEYPTQGTGIAPE